jgi:hypothetical protein
MPTNACRGARVTDDETFEIGYAEDGVMWVTASSKVPDAEAAERYMGGGWRVVEAVFLAPTGLWLNSKDAEWAVCDADAPSARPGWRLVDADAPQILDPAAGEEIPNPLYRPPDGRG